MQHLDMTWNPAKFKILGIWFSNDLSDCIHINYKDKLLEIKNLYRIWLKRQITPLGRIAILKSLILSKLIYLWLLLPNPPDDIVNDIQKDVFSFVWNKKNDRIARKTSVQNLENGGIGIPNIRCYLDALKLTWIRKLATSNHHWKNILFHLAPFTSSLDQFGANIPTDKMNIFWKQVFQAYVRLEQSTLLVDTSESILREPIFYNTNIRINNKAFYHHNWFINGISNIKHFVNNDGQFYSLQEFNNKYNINETNFLFYGGCIAAIRSMIRRTGVTIDNNNSSEVSLLQKSIHSFSKGAKYLYNLLNWQDCPPNYCQKWQEKLEVEVVNWKSAFQNIIKIKEVKLKWFEIRILHRIICTNITLYGMHLKPDDLCTFCNEERETIEHLFTECEFVLVFFHQLRRLLLENHVVNDDFELNCEFLLFGIAQNKNYAINDQLQYIFLVAKYFIYKSRCEEVLPVFASFLGYFAKYFETIRYIAIKNMCKDKFDNDWENYKFLIPTSFRHYT